MSDANNDEQFYRDTESIAFPKLTDRQLALLEPSTWPSLLNRHF